jgi:hypothetical protein
VSKLSLNELQTVAWLSASVSLIDSANNYTNKLDGLMGNYNGDPADDVFSRTGARPTNLDQERAVYDIAITCKACKHEKLKINYKIKNFINLREFNFRRRRLILSNSCQASKRC